MFEMPNAIKINVETSFNLQEVKKCYKKFNTDTKFIAENISLKNIFNMNSFSLVGRNNIQPDKNIFVTIISNQQHN